MYTKLPAERENGQGTHSTATIAVAPRLHRTNESTFTPNRHQSSAERDETVTSISTSLSCVHWWAPLASASSWQTNGMLPVPKASRASLGGVKEKVN